MPMESLRALYRVGRGPSSSHTMGPESACRVAAARFPDADRYEVTLYGSLAKTGRGHGTDRVIETTLAPLPVNVRFDSETADLPHPNTLDLVAYRGGREIGRLRVMSVGGGRIVCEGEESERAPRVYPEDTFFQIAELCKREGMALWEYVVAREGEGVRDFARRVWEQMKDTVARGLRDEGVLPGGLNVQKKAKFLYEKKVAHESKAAHENRLICAYAFAVGEQNADAGVVVTAPTCGSAGVLPASLLFEQQKHGQSDDEVINSLLTAGLIGNLIKTNASISGAECGCQAEIGAACAMAAAGLGELRRLDIDRIEYAAEIAVEHHLGLTCDPICGLVQIPCIERNAVAAMRALNAVRLADILSDTRRISLDNVILTMKNTGRDLGAAYRETAEGGLAKLEL